ncbi:ribonuclease HII [Anaerorhabdus sp.]|uniref:ribonuclease HII n=1 Tax=Anaerorhabdus sp. TaxID=1872524 RepID=UPI002B1E9C0C|nr:ribonuclease HII [Anaerorhabdus sp.]MEA4875114.1 ribonuclease HII [Anaerorhabdus sp.]
MIKQTSNEYEHQYWNEEQVLIGIDEAGRGPLAGPLVVAGVVFEKGYENPLIYDSKGISEKKREELFKVIIQDAKEYKIEIVTPKQIDEENIYRATQHAMNRIATTLHADIVLTDAMPLPGQEKKVIDLIKGDQKSISIAAASILAKVVRDHIMFGYDILYPDYGFKKHKGYPTKQHIEALDTYGVLDIHRRSYGPVQRCLQIKLEL